MTVLLPLLVTTMASVCGIVEDRSAAASAAADQKLKVISRSGLRVTTAEKNLLLRLEEDYLDAKAISTSIAECSGVLTEPNEIELANRLHSQRVRLDVLFANYVNAKGTAKEILSKVRAYSQRKAGNALLLSEVRNEVARLRFQAASMGAEFPRSCEFEVLDSPIGDGTLKFSVGGFVLHQGERMRTEGDSIRVCAVDYDKRSRALNEMRSSDRVLVGLFNGESLHYETKDGRLQTTWSTLGEEYRWRTACIPANAASFALLDLERDQPYSRKKLCDVRLLSAMVDVELQVEGSIEWRQESVRNGVTTESIERNPVRGTIKLRLWSI